MTADGADDQPPRLEFRVVAADVVDSTNEEAARLAAAGAAAGTVVWARQQRAGRGRRGRAWVSPEGNLYCSVILRPDRPLAVAAQVSFVAAVAVAEAVSGIGAGAVVPQLKWPNDVLIGGRKVAGILLEAGPARDGQAEWLIVGVGINCRDCPVGVDYPATALAQEGLAGVEVAALLERFLGCLAGGVGRWQRDGFGPVRAAWLERAIGVGRNLTVRLPQATVEGTFAGLGEDGTLLLGVPGEPAARRIAAGDVFFPWLSSGGVGASC